MDNMKKILRYFKNNVEDFKKLNTKKKYLVLGISIIISTFLFVITSQTYVATNKEIKETRSVLEFNLGGVEENNITTFKDSYKKVLETFDPIFLGFISKTPDVTGKSQEFMGGSIFNVLGYSDVLLSDGGRIDSSIKYSSKLMIIVIPSISLLLSIYVFTELLKEGDSKLPMYQVIIRVVKTVILLIITPHILSLSIQGANLISKFLMNNGGMLDFLKNFIDQISSDPSPDNFLSNLFFGGTSFFGFLQSLPVLIPIMIIVILFIFLAFQFIIRFVQMYFLACIYPLAVLFEVHPKMGSVSRNYWKTWISLLIHQPFFILGYVLVQEMLLQMLKSGPSLVQIIMFVGLLLFLSGINVLVSKIFGDVFTSISQNVLAAAGTSIVNKYTNLKSRFVNRKKYVRNTSKSKTK